MFNIFDTSDYLVEYQINPKCYSVVKQALQDNAQCVEMECLMFIA